MFLGIDLGTSATKAVLVDERQQVIASAVTALSPVSRQPGWSEDDPDAWWAAVDQSVLTLRQDHPGDLHRVRAIGLSGQMHACLLLDARDRPLRPAILWSDGRSLTEAAALNRSAPQLAIRLGVPPAAGFTAPKIAWLRTHEPALVDEVTALLLPKDEIRLRLTGEKATDPSDAAGTWLLDQATRTWSPDAVAACGAEPGWLPPLLEADTVAGRLRAPIAERWGLEANLPVACGGGDTPVGGLGIGAIGADDGFVSLGTSAQVFLADRRYTPAPDQLVHAFCHASPDRWYSMAALLNGGSALASAVSWAGGGDIGAMLQRVEAAYAGPSPLLALPYLAGERTPHDDPQARGVLFGLTAGTRPEDIVLAVLEGGAFALADGVAALGSARSIPDTLGLIGGGARSDFWGSMISNVLGIRLVRYRDAHHGPAFGAARLARLSVTEEGVDAVATKPAIDRVFEPDPAAQAAYVPRLEAFRHLYRALAPEFGRTVAR